MVHQDLLVCFVMVRDKAVNPRFPRQASAASQLLALVIPPLT